jgi:hypothetical protein
MINPIDYIHKYPHRSKQILGISYKAFLQLVQQACLRQSHRHWRLEQKKPELMHLEVEGNQFYQGRVRLVYVYFTCGICQHLRF